MSCFFNAKNALSLPLKVLGSTVLKPAIPVLSFERHLGRGVSQNRRQKMKQPGVKRCDGDYVRKGEIIAKQFFLVFHPGLNVDISSANTLKATREGLLVMTCEKINPTKGHPVADKYYGNMSAPAVYKRFFHVIPFTQGQKFKLVDLV